MNKKWLALIFSALILMSNVTGITSAEAATSQVTVSSSSLNPGQAMTISGDSTYPEVVVKVIDISKNLVEYIDTVQVLNGHYSTQFNISSGASNGIHKVVVGIGSDVSATEFTVVYPQTPGDGGNVIGPGGGSGGGGGGVPGITSPTPTPTPTPTAAPTSTPVAIATPAPIIVELAKGTLTKETGTDGTETSVFTYGITDVNNAFKLLKEKTDAGAKGAAQIISIDLKDVDGPIKVNIPASALIDAAALLPNSLVSVQSNQGGYVLPLSVVNLGAILQSLGDNSENAIISIKINKVNTATADKIDQTAKDLGITPLGTAVDFTVSIESDGKTIELNDFGTTYVDRSIIFTFAMDENTTTAVVYDPETGKLSFVPAVFTKQTDGSTKVTIKRNGNSAYSVVTSNKTFNDVNKHWAKADIELLASKLIVTGTTSTSFAPESSITRAEFAALLVRSLGLSNEKSTVAFTDVKDSDWFAGTVGAAVKAKLVSGFEDNTFKPNDQITREQMAVMISRAASAAGQTIKLASTQEQLLLKFSDQSSIHEWAKAAVSETVQASIVTGVTTDTFVPSAQASRAQAVVMLKRMLQYVQFIN